MIYLIGSMRNPRVPIIANELRAEGFDVFDDWYSPGKNADDDWQAYEQQRGRSFANALKGNHAKEVFEFDLLHLNKASAAVLVMPAGKSAHLELGWLIGQGKPGFILLPSEPERFDIMYSFASGVTSNLQELVHWLEGVPLYNSNPFLVTQESTSKINWENLNIKNMGLED